MSERSAGPPSSSDSALFELRRQSSGVEKLRDAAANYIPALTKQNVSQKTNFCLFFLLPDASSASVIRVGMNLFYLLTLL